jgi:3-dehydroquinate dehydratase
MSTRDRDPFLLEQPTKEEIAALMNTMHIEGYMVTEDQAIEAWHDFYTTEGLDRLAELLKKMKEPSADLLALTEHFVQRRRELRKKQS